MSKLRLRKTNPDSESESESGYILKGKKMDMDKYRFLCLVNSLVYNLDKHITNLARASLDSNPDKSREKIREVFESWYDSAKKAEEESEAWEAVEYE